MGPGTWNQEVDAWMREQAANSLFGNAVCVNVTRGIFESLFFRRVCPCIQCMACCPSAPVFFLFLFSAFQSLFSLGTVGGCSSRPLFELYIAPGGPALSLGATPWGSQPMGRWVWDIPPFWGCWLYTPFYVFNLVRSLHHGRRMLCLKID